ncbi:MAG: hypothetical protein J6V80_05235 [Clostridia bacterium]|nr:hypothetical protein [Clostridia bacterium]
MTKTTNQNRILWLINKICAVLPVFFWLFLIFGFESPEMAAITILSALAHELGHLTYICMRGKSKINLRGSINGFRINSNRSISYGEEIATYASGPLVNILLWLIFSLLYPILGYFSALIAIINLATAVSNLLPIKGYDGYGIIRAALEKRSLCGRSLVFLSRISSCLVLALCILSLYLIDRKGGGYWIFAIFFISMLNHIKDGLGE